MKIDYNNYKESLINLLESDNKFKDYDYTGSNINILLDILSRNVHGYGFYANMVMRESSPKTAQRLDSLQGYATRHSFLIRSNAAAMTTLTIKIKPKNDVKTIYIPKNSKFASINDREQSVTFITLNDYTLSDIDSEGYIYGDITVYEGELKTDLIEVNNSVEKYIINDEKIDITTLKIQVKNTIKSNYGAEYELANNNYVPKPNDNVYYLSLVGKRYSLYFGNNVFGNQPKVGQYIRLEYLHTMGIMGNGSNNFRYSKKPNVTYPSIIDHYDDVIITAHSSASGGYSGVNKDNLKIALSNYGRVKSVAINDNDYKSVILSNYPDIDSIAVWGGEKHSYRKYGKLFISIKPKYGRLLSTTLQEDIRNHLVNNYSLLAENIMFVDPNYLFLDINIIFTKNSLSKDTNNQKIKSDLKQLALKYNNDYLGKFDLVFNENDFINYISQDYKNAYTNLYIKKTISYDLPLLFGNNRNYDFDFKNPLLRFETESFYIGSKKAYYLYDKEMSPLSTISLYVDDKIAIKDAGNINLDTGKLTIVIPESLDIPSIKLIATPVDSSIETTYDRIIQLNNIKVDIK